MLKSEKFGFLLKNVFTFVNAIVQQLKTITMKAFKTFTYLNGELNLSKERVEYLNLYWEYVWKNHDRIHRDATMYANINSN